MFPVFLQNVYKLSTTPALSLEGLFVYLNSNKTK